MPAHRRGDRRPRRRARIASRRSFPTSTPRARRSFARRGASSPIARFAWVPCSKDCDLLVSHGGNICPGSLMSGVPQLVFPTQYEQYLTAHRIAQLGAGAWVGPEAPAGAVAAALDRLLSDPSFKRAAKAFAARLPGLLARRAAAAHRESPRRNPRETREAQRVAPRQGRAYTLGHSTKTGSITMNLVDRVKKLMLQPKSEWQVIDGETHTVPGALHGYVMILAAIPAVCSFIGLSLIGIERHGRVVPRADRTGRRAPRAAVRTRACGSSTCSRSSSTRWRPTSARQKNFMQALKMSAFVPDGAWIGGVFGIIPVLGDHRPALRPLQPLPALHRACRC